MRAFEKLFKKTIKILTISSGPSQECLYGNPSGTILFNIISISSLFKYREKTIKNYFKKKWKKTTYLTSGSQLSFNAKLADVCKTVQTNKKKFVIIVTLIRRIF